MTRTLELAQRQLHQGQPHYRSPASIPQDRHGPPAAQTGQLAQQPQNGTAKDSTE